MPVTIRLPDESSDILLTPPYLKYSLPPDSFTVQLDVTRFVALVEFVALVALVALVAVAALPEMLMFQVPDAPVPVGPGTSVPITKPRLDLAPDAVVAPVPPYKTASAEDKDEIVELEMVTPETVPPVMATLLAFWVDIVPRPNVVIAPVTNAVVAI